MRDERSTPGSSSSAKLGDLRAGSSCRARTAPRYGEALVVVSSRNQNPDFASTGPCYGAFARLGLKACVCVPCRARIETSGPGWSRGSRQRIVGPCLVEFDAKIMIFLTTSNKKSIPITFIINLQVARAARAPATSHLRDRVRTRTRSKVSHHAIWCGYACSITNMFDKDKNVRLERLSHRTPTRASELAT